MTEGGFLAIHDVFEDPADGGRPPFECYREALDSGAFVEDELARSGSLRVLVRVSPGTSTPKTAHVLGSATCKTSAARMTAAAE